MLAKDPNAERYQGDLKGTVMMIDFDSLNAARKFYLSVEYQAGKAIREANLMLIEGPK